MSLAFLATVGPPCGSMEMYHRAKTRLFGAMYGKEPKAAMEAYSIMHKLQKKAFGIWSPFQMEDFLDYPVVKNDQRQTSLDNPRKYAPNRSVGVLAEDRDLVVSPVVCPMSPVHGVSTGTG